MLASKFITNPLRQSISNNACKAVVEFNKFSNYCEMIKNAKSKAKKSILIDHCGIEHIDYKTEFNNVDYVYSIEKETKRGLTKLSLIEFKTEQDAENVAKQARHNVGLLPVPLKVFRYVGNEAPTPEKQKVNFPVEKVKLSYKMELCDKFDSYSQLLCNNMMSLVALKLRFITLVNFERILCAGMFEEYELLPFGSSVIDLGSDSSDLDLVVSRKEDKQQLESKNQIKNSLSIIESSSSKSKLVHLDKSLYSEIKDKSGIRGTMRWFDHILREYMPLTDGYGVLFVKHAKVPIIKFTARITSVDCDLSFNLGLDHRERDLTNLNSPGILMAQILYTLCRNNNLFTAVTIYLRIFGRLTDITSKEPNVGLTNFQYLSLIIFYLQQVSICQDLKVIVEHSLPSFKQEIKKTKSTDKSSIKENNRTIVPQFKEMLGTTFSPKNLIYKDDEIDRILPEVIVGFFEFYSRFDFTGTCLNLFDGRIERKLDNSSLYVQNPLDRSHNICHNVNRKGVDNFVKQCKLSLLGMKQASQYNCPLTLIRCLMVKSNQQQAKKVRQLKFTAEGTHLDLQTHYKLSSEGVAQDVCR